MHFHALLRLDLDEPTDPDTVLAPPGGITADEAWSSLQLGSRQEQSSQTPFPHRWAVMFLVAVGFWNFSGPGCSGSWSTCRWCPTTKSARR